LPLAPIMLRVDSPGTWPDPPHKVILAKLSRRALAVRKIEASQSLQEAQIANPREDSAERESPARSFKTRYVPVRR
jgi:hypothetical protein